MHDLTADVTCVLRTYLIPQTRMMLRRLLVGPIVGEPIKVGGRRGLTRWEVGRQLRA